MKHAFMYILQLDVSVAAYTILPLLGELPVFCSQILQKPASGCAENRDQAAMLEVETVSDANVSVFVNPTCPQSDIASGQLVQTFESSSNYAWLA